MGQSFPLGHESLAPRDQSTQPPAVILIHGRGANEHDLLPLAEELPDALHVLSVRAPKPLGPGFTWYDLDLSGGGLHASQPDPEEFDQSLERLNQFVEQAIEVYNLDPNRVGLLGFSQGAILGMSAAIEFPGVHPWVVALHGYLPDRYDRSDLEEAIETALFIGAGTHDQIIPVTRGEDAARKFDAAGVDVTFRTYPVGHTTSPAELNDVRQWLESQIV